MHNLQKKIIVKLAANSPLRFSQLQPAGIANNTFSYHLKQLVLSGYVSHNAQGYVPTRKALKTLEYADIHKNKSQQPKLITMLLIRAKTGEILLLERARSPFKRWLGLPSGLIHHGEAISKAAQRELKEKTDLTSRELTFAGMLDFRYLENKTGDMFVHALASVYCLELDQALPVLSPDEERYGKLVWSKMSHKNILPDVKRILELSQKGTIFVDSVDFIEPKPAAVLTRK